MLAGKKDSDQQIFKHLMHRVDWLRDVRGRDYLDRLSLMIAEWAELGMVLPVDILRNVGLPRTMPFFFASLKVAISYAFVGAVLSETVASNRGIGNVMMTASSNFNVPLVFAGLFVLAGLGVALYVIFSAIEGRVTGWATRKNDLIAT